MLQSSSTLSLSLSGFVGALQLTTAPLAWMSDTYHMKVNTIKTDVHKAPSKSHNKSDFILLP